MFLSPDRRLLSIVGEWGPGVILDTLDGKITPFSENLVLEGIFNWFPDSQHMLAEASRHSLWLIDPIRGDYSRLAVPGMGDIDSASASPDGRSIVYSHEFGSSTHLRIVDSDGRNDRMLLELKNRVTNLTWSPDNNKIAFHGEGWISLDLRDLSAVKLGFFPVVNSDFNTPSWSPDSRYLALVVCNVSLCEGSGEDLIKDANIVIFDVETGEHRTIRPDGETGNANPVWSPDSSRIVFISNYGGQPDLWSLNFKDGSVDQITNQGRFFYLLSWQNSE
jgi:Tol biopolymer transport system component